jgi:hypothetical protein
MEFVLSSPPAAFTGFEPAGVGERFRSPAILASGSALGSLSSVALPSVRLLVAPMVRLGANFLNSTPADGSGRCRERSRPAGKPR